MENLDSLFNIVSSSIKNSCTNVAAMYMFANQLEDLTKHIEWLSVPETSHNEEIEKLKLEIYSFYKEHLSSVINKYEVYFHNFPENAAVILSEVVLDLSKASDPNITYNDSVYYLQRIHKVNLVLYYTIGIELIKYYKKQVKTYKKVLKKFNYMAVPYRDTNKLFKDEVKLEEKSIKKIYKDIKVKYNSFFKAKNKDGSFDYDLDKIVSTKNKDGKEIVDELKDKLEKLINDFEHHYPEIVDCGYNAPLLRKVGSFALFVLLPILLAVITILRCRA